MRRTRSWGAERESLHFSRPAPSAYSKGPLFNHYRKAGPRLFQAHKQTAGYKYPRRLEVQRTQQLALQWKLQLTEQAAPGSPRITKRTEEPKSNHNKTHSPPCSPPPSLTGLGSQGDSMTSAAGALLNSVLWSGCPSPCTLSSRPGQLVQGKMRTPDPTESFEELSCTLKESSLCREYILPQFRFSVLQLPR